MKEIGSSGYPWRPPSLGSDNEHPFGKQNILKYMNVSATFTSQFMTVDTTYVTQLPIEINGNFTQCLEKRGQYFR